MLYCAARPEVRYAKEALRVDRAAKSRSLYARARRKGQWHRVWALLTKRPHRLLSLAEAEATCPVCGRSDATRRTVPIDHIQGSEDRVNDFDRSFHPIQGHTERRWLNIASARLQGKDLPPVRLIQVGDAYYCRDGHHRISVARALGQRDIDAVVTVWRVSRSPAPAPAVGQSMPAHAVAA